MQEIALKAIFSTTHMSDNESQSMNIKNIDDITNQVGHLLNSLFVFFFCFLVVAYKTRWK
jgi:hypothetical protein